MTTTATHFTILENKEDHNLNSEEVVVWNEIRKDNKLSFSIVAMFAAFTGRDVKLISWTQGDAEVKVLGRGGVLTEAGKKARNFQSI